MAETQGRRVSACCGTTWTTARPAVAVCSGCGLECHLRGQYCGPGGMHLPLVLVSRSWRDGWRRRRTVRCWECDLKIPEPLRTLPGVVVWFARDVWAAIKGVYLAVVAVWWS